MNDYGCGAIPNKYIIIIIIRCIYRTGKYNGYDGQMYIQDW